MASLSSPIGPTIDVVARTVSRSVISGGAGGGGGIPGGGGGGGGRGGALAVQPQASLVNVERNLEVQTTQNIQQTQEISALRGTVDALRTETATLNNGLGTVSNLIQQDSAVEKQQAAAEAENERKLLERNIRLGKESQLEQNITNALAKPVQALQQKVGNIFGRIGEALTTLFAGWLTNQGIEALKAESEGNKNKLEEIKDNVLKHIGYAVGAFAAIKIGFDLIIKTITGLAGKIGGLVLKLATAPLNLLRSTLQAAPVVGGLFGGPKPGAGGGPKPGAKPGAKPAARGPGLAGGLSSAFGAGMNLKSGENIDAAINTAGLFPGMPGAVARGASVLDDLTEVFLPGFRGGAGLFGNTPRGGEKPPTPAATPAAKVLPTTPMAGDSKPEPPPTIMAPAEADAKISSSTQAPAAPPASEAQTSMMPQAAELSLNNPPGALVPGQRPDKALTSEQFKIATQAREEAKIKGLTGKEYDVYVANAVMNVQPSDVNISSPAQVQSLPKPTQNVGELPEPAPNIVMMPSGQGNNQQSSISQAPTNGTDTPLISSSNPDNFYVLYSQLNYNVVM